jgi:hypothetical protein
MSAATFVLMNCDLVAVPLQSGAGVVTVYCGVRRANELLATNECEAGDETGSNRLRGAAAQTASRRHCSVLRGAALVDRL